MIHVYECKKCSIIKEIDKPLSEQYVPECCGSKMVRVFTVPGIVAGCLNGNNIGK